MRKVIVFLCLTISFLKGMDSKEKVSWAAAQNKWQSLLNLNVTEHNQLEGHKLEPDERVIKFVGLDGEKETFEYWSQPDVRVGALSAALAAQSRVSSVLLFPIDSLGKPDLMKDSLAEGTKVSELSRAFKWAHRTGSLGWVSKQRHDQLKAAKTFR